MDKQVTEGSDLNVDVENYLQNNEFQLCNAQRPVDIDEETALCVIHHQTTKVYYYVQKPFMARN